MANVSSADFADLSQIVVYGLLSLRELYAPWAAATTGAFCIPTDRGMRVGSVMTDVLVNVPATFNAAQTQQVLADALASAGGSVGASGATADTNVTDVDECATHVSECHANATCTNVLGGYACTCPDTMTDAAKEGEKAGTNCVGE